MKLLIFILLLSIFAYPLQLPAQTTFAPPGAEWYQNMGDSVGLFHSYYAGDTTIDGIICSKVLQEAITMHYYDSMGLVVVNLPALYVYSNSDTVFMYNTLFRRFTPLYIFNVNAGDTICLPILPPDPDGLNSAITDSVFCFRVDSVKMVVYDTASLKTVYTHSLGNPFADSVYIYQYNSGYYTNDSTGAYANRLGTISGGLLPACQSCPNLLDESLQFEKGIRCYNDLSTSIKLITGECGLPPTSVAVVSKELITVYPNPSADVIHIAFAPTLPAADIQILDMEGHRLIEITPGKSVSIENIAVSSLPPGIYMLRLSSANGYALYKKLCIVR